ncbi:hypothetical protein ACTFIR_003777 [Dictyostelium discoideum]
MSTTVNNNDASGSSTSASNNAESFDLRMKSMEDQINNLSLAFTRFMKEPMFSSNTNSRSQRTHDDSDTENEQSDDESSNNVDVPTDYQLLVLNNTDKFSRRIPSDSVSNTGETLVPVKTDYHRDSFDAQCEKIRAAILAELRSDYKVDLKTVSLFTLKSKDIVSILGKKITKHLHQPRSNN